VAVFETAPLPDDVVIAGQVVARLFVLVDAPDADITVKLVDVHPDGAAFGITDGILRLRFREGYEAERLLAPGEIVEAVVEPFATAMRFAEGHRIRIDIAASNFPKFDVNPQTGGPLGRPGPVRVARVTVNCGPATPSRVVMPVWRT
jgi:putative CocE/NonD family hydrolase